jgi:iron complex transport system substrate-binding protein
MLGEIGCQNIADTAEIVLDSISEETILKFNPDYIFISTMGKEEAAKSYMDSVLKGKVFSSLDCVKNGNYCYLPKELFQFKPNNRWDEAYLFLTDIVYGK